MWTIVLSAGSAQMFRLVCVLDHGPPDGVAMEDHVRCVEQQRRSLAKEELTEQRAQYPATTGIPRTLGRMAQAAQFPFVLFGKGTEMKTYNVL